jgi:hypothetical protein
MAKRISQGFFQGLSINVSEIPTGKDFCFVWTYKDHRYRVSFRSFQQQHGFRCENMVHKYIMDVCSLRNMTEWHKHGNVVNIIAELESINICEQCQIPVSSATVCANCKMRSCFSFGEEMHIDECSICIRPLIGSSNVIYTTPCGHTFHARCFAQIKPKGRTHIHVEDCDDDDCCESRAIRVCPTCKVDVEDNVADTEHLHDVSHDSPCEHHHGENE